MVVIGGNLDNSGWIIGRELLLHGYFGRFVLYAFGWYDEENDHIFFFQAALVKSLFVQFLYERNLSTKNFLFKGIIYNYTVYMPCFRHQGICYLLDKQTFSEVEFY